MLKVLLNAYFQSPGTKRTNGTMDKDQIAIQHKSEK
jgi:hypothetical protein